MNSGKYSSVPSTIKPSQFGDFPKFQVNNSLSEYTRPIRSLVKPSVLLVSVLLVSVLRTSVLERRSILTSFVNEVELPRSRCIGRKFLVYVFLGGKLLSGFAPGTVARLGVGPYPGLHVRAEVTAGQFAKPQMHIQLCVRHRKAIDRFKDIIFLLSNILDDIAVLEIGSSDESALAPLHKFEEFDMPELARHPDFDTFAEQLRHADLTDPAASISLITSRVRHVRVDIDGSQAMAVDSVRFTKNWNTHPPSTTAIARTVNDVFTLDRPLSVGLWFFCEDTFEAHWPKILQDVQHLPNPFADYLANCRAGDYRDLGYANIAEIPDEYRPERPIPATTIFQDNEHRTVALIAGASEELEMHDKRSRFLFDNTLPVVLIEDKFSRWMPEETDLDRHGIMATGCVTHYFGVVALDPDIAGAFPDIGEPFSLYLGAHMPITPCLRQSWPQSSPMLLLCPLFAISIFLNIEQRTPVRTLTKRSTPLWTMKTG